MNTAVVRAANNFDSITCVAGEKPMINGFLCRSQFPDECLSESSCLSANTKGLTVIGQILMISALLGWVLLTSSQSTSALQSTSEHLPSHSMNLCGTCRGHFWTFSINQYVRQRSNSISEAIKPVMRFEEPKGKCQMSELRL